LGVLSNPDPSSECSKQSDSGAGWEVTLGLRIGEHWVHVMEWLHGFPPMIPIALPFIGVRSHDPSIDIKPCNLEKISILTLLLNSKICHEVACGCMRKARIEMM
jgi:hypothetical protein